MQQLHLLTDNHDLPPEDYEKVRPLMSTLYELFLDWRNIVELRGLDPEVFLPGNIWGEIIDLNRHPAWNYEMVNYARCVFCGRQSFERTPH